MIVKTLEVGPFDTNCYLVFVEERKALYIIDPGDDGERIVAEAKKFDYDKVELLLTHFHIDHIHAAGFCAAALGCDCVRLRTPDPKSPRCTGSPMPRSRPRSPVV